MEKWVKIPNYDGVYEVSDLGRVRSFKYGKCRLLKKRINSGGYEWVALFKQGKRKDNQVHRLVFFSFNKNASKSKDLVIDHIDNKKTNNTLSNLQLISMRRNRVKDIDKTTTSSKYIGVALRCDKKKYVARIIHNKKSIHLGSFSNEYDAHLAYESYKSKHCIENEANL